MTEVQRDVVDVLTADHREFDRIFTELEGMQGRSDPETLRRRFAALCRFAKGLTVAVLARNRYRLTLVRTVTPQLVSAGQPARVTLTLANDGLAPNGVLLLEDQVPDDA